MAKVRRIWKMKETVQGSVEAMVRVGVRLEVFKVF